MNDITGIKFGRLTAIKVVGKSKTTAGTFGFASATVVTNTLYHIQNYQTANPKVAAVLGEK